MAEKSVDSSHVNSATAHAVSDASQGTAVLDAPAKSGADRRRSVREKKNLPAWLSAATGSRSETGFNVTILDLSMHGAGFHVSKKLTVGDTHWMVVSGETLRLSTRLQVVSCRARDDGNGYVVGAEFF